MGDLTIFDEIWQLMEAFFRSGKTRQLTQVEISVLQSLIHHCGTATLQSWIPIELVNLRLLGALVAAQKAIRGLETKGFILVDPPAGKAVRLKLNQSLVAEMQAWALRNPDVCQPPMA